MTIEELYTALTSNGFDAHYGEAPNGTSCPYVVLTNITHNNFASDNRTYFKTTELRLRLVEAQHHDWELIDKLEDLLDSLCIPYGSVDVQDPSENVCETYYDITITGGTYNA